MEDLYKSLSTDKDIIVEIEAGKDSGMKINIRGLLIKEYNGTFLFNSINCDTFENKILKFNVNPISKNLNILLVDNGEKVTKTYPIKNVNILDENIEDQSIYDDDMKYSNEEISVYDDWSGDTLSFSINNDDNDDYIGEIGGENLEYFRYHNEKLCEDEIDEIREYIQDKYANF